MSGRQHGGAHAAARVVQQRCLRFDGPAAPISEGGQLLLPVRAHRDHPCRPAPAMPDGVNVTHSNNRLQLAVAGNPHFDEDSYVRKRRRRSVAPVKDSSVRAHLTGEAVSDVAMSLPRTASGSAHRSCRGRFAPLAK